MNHCSSASATEEYADFPPKHILYSSTNWFSPFWLKVLISEISFCTARLEGKTSYSFMAMDTQCFVYLSIVYFSHKSGLQCLMRKKMSSTWPQGYIECFFLLRNGECKHLFVYTQTKPTCVTLIPLTQWGCFKPGVAFSGGKNISLAISYPASSSFLPCMIQYGFTL